MAHSSYIKNWLYVISGLWLVLLYSNAQCAIGSWFMIRYLELEL
jgi:hypothetical protein